MLVTNHLDNTSKPDTFYIIKFIYCCPWRCTNDDNNNKRIRNIRGCQSLNPTKYIVIVYNNIMKKTGNITPWFLTHWKPTASFKQFDIFLSQFPYIWIRRCLGSLRVYSYLQSYSWPFFTLLYTPRTEDRLLSPLARLLPTLPEPELGVSYLPRFSRLVLPRFVCGVKSEYTSLSAAILCSLLIAVLCHSLQHIGRLTSYMKCRIWHTTSDMTGETTEAKVRSRSLDL
jgi:hypothetical protein